MVGIDLKDIRLLSFEELEKTITSWGFQKFRAQQVWQWVWKKRTSSFDQCLNLSKELRNQLKEHFCFNIPTILKHQISEDGTEKFAFRLFDGNIVEGVLIPDNQRYTACISSQVGCSLDCKFCATGLLKLKRNLEAYEISDQFELINQKVKQKYGKSLTNVVYMGMGEPLLNYKNVMASIDNLTSAEKFGISPQRITVSTAGISKMIEKMAQDEVKFNLAISLHQALDEKRTEIMPINASNDLNKLAQSLKKFTDSTGRIVTLEYCLIKDINDQEEDLLSLIQFSKKFKSKVNLIEYNPIGVEAYQSSAVNYMVQFAEKLKNQGVLVSIRRSRGKDIDAACGQLAAKN